VIGQLWQRLRSRFSAEPQSAPQPVTTPASAAGYLADDGQSASTPYVPQEPPPPAEPTPVDQLAEALSERLVEDESLRGDLTDDEYQPLLDWATKRIEQLAESARPLAPATAERYFNQVADQLLELLRTIELAVAQRGGASPELVVSRLELLDTLLVPPLLTAPAATAAQARLEALLAHPPEWLRSVDGATLVQRIVDLVE
jgi:hypothetical protein